MHKCNKEKKKSTSLSLVKMLFACLFSTSAEDKDFVCARKGWSFIAKGWGMGSRRDPWEQSTDRESGCLILCVASTSYSIAHCSVVHSRCSSLVWKGFDRRLFGAFGTKFTLASSMFSCLGQSKGLDISLFHFTSTRLHFLSHQLSFTISSLQPSLLYNRSTPYTLLHNAHHPARSQPLSLRHLQP